MIFAVPFDEARYALVDTRGWLESMVALNGADVRVGLPDVARLHRLWIEQRLSASLPLEQLDDAHQVFAAAVADVVEGVRRCGSAGLHLPVVSRRTVETSNDAADDIVDVGEVPAHLAAVEEWQRLAGVERPDENPHGHVGAAPRTVHGEEAQNGERQPVQACVAFA